MARQTTYHMFGSNETRFSADCWSIPYIHIIFPYFYQTIYANVLKYAKCIWNSINIVVIMLKGTRCIKFYNECATIHQLYFNYTSTILQICINNTSPILQLSFTHSLKFNVHLPNVRNIGAPENRKTSGITQHLLHLSFMIVLCPCNLWAWFEDQHNTQMVWVGVLIRESYSSMINTPAIYCKTFR